MRRRAILLSLPMLPRVAMACGRLADGQVLRGRFVQTRLLRGFSRPLVSEGKFVLAPDQGLIWRAETPFAVVTAMSARGLVQHMRGNETFRLNADRIPFMTQLFEMLRGALSGDWTSLRKDFDIERTGDTGSWRMLLTPRNAASPAMPFQTIKADGGCLVENVVLAKPNGDSDTLRFLDQNIATGPLDTEELALLATMRP